MSSMILTTPRHLCRRIKKGVTESVSSDDITPRSRISENYSDSFLDIRYAIGAKFQVRTSIAAIPVGGHRIASVEFCDFTPELIS